MTGRGETCVSDPYTYTISRYRLELVCEEEAIYDAGDDCGDPIRAAEFLRRTVGWHDREVMGVLLLTVRNRPIGYHVAYVGTSKRLLAEPRGLLVPALLANAVNIVLFHTHPSGDPAPSKEDIEFTKNIAIAARLLGLHVVDHIILGEGNRYCSLRHHPDWPDVENLKGVFIQ